MHGASHAEKRSLKFREDGTFTIVQFTDLHIGCGGDKDVQTVSLMEKVIDAEKPDFIVFTGDMLWRPHDHLESMRRAVGPAARSGIPWSAVFGNHDAEWEVTREELLAVQLESASCLTQAGPDELSGVGNYRLEVAGSRSGDSAALLYFLDSGNKAPESVGGYDWIHANQIHWYTVRSREGRRSEELVPALCFFHIPLPEYEMVWQSGEAVGHKLEPVCCPRLNSGLFAAMVENGDVAGVFVGHDHDNDYYGTLHGIRLCYGRVGGYSTYGKLERGARVIRLSEGKREFETWQRLDNGQAIY